MDQKKSRLKSPSPMTKAKKKHISEKTRMEDPVIHANLMGEENLRKGMAVPIPASQKSKDKTSCFFINEIRAMMYGFGDCRCPLLKSAEVVERIVKNQMCEMLFQTARNARLRKGDRISHEDILFLLRKDKVKLRRLLKCLEVKDIRMEIEHKKPQADESETASNCPSENQTNDKRCYEEEVTTKKKRVQSCLSFLNKIAVANEYSDLMDDDVIDPIVFERRLRCAENSEKMTPDEYIEYSVARQAAFAHNRRGKGKFKDWLLLINQTGLEPTEFAYELFIYFAHETVAQIVDLALLVRQDSEPDPFDRLRPNTINISDALLLTDDDLDAKSPNKNGSPSNSLNASPQYASDSPASPDMTTSPVTQHCTDTSLLQYITKSPPHEHSTLFMQPTPTSQQQSPTSIPHHTFDTSPLQKQNETSPHQLQNNVSPQHNITSTSVQETSSSTVQWLTSPPGSSSTRDLSVEEKREKRRKLLEKKRKLLKKRRKFLRPRYEGEYSPFNPITPREINEVMRRYSQPIGPFYAFSHVCHKKLFNHLLCC